jgi:hypothetical protein
MRSGAPLPRQPLLLVRCTALSLVATLDEVGRFRGAHQVEACFTKASNSWMRRLLAEGAFRLM